MKLFDIYTLWIGKESDFCNKFQSQDDLYKQAKDFWETLGNLSFVFLIILLVLGIGSAFFYYTPFNKMAGRHYHPKWWLIFMVICFVSTLLFTLGAAYLFAEPKLDGAFMLEFNLSLVNSIYATVLYLFISWLYCNYFPTNAYRLLQ